MITIKDIYLFCSKLLSNPVFQFIYPFLVFGITLLIDNNSKNLSFQVLNVSSKIEELTENEKKALGLSNQNKIYQDKIAIYNDGNCLIDNVDFINEKHISLSKKGSRILSAKTIKSNRNQLKINQEIDTLKSNTIYLNIMNNEVLEQNDVFVIQVVYTGLKNAEWKIKSRIKGIPQGITKGDIHRNESDTIRWTTIILLGIFLIMVFRFVLFRLKNNPFYIRKVELYPILTFMGIAAVMYYEYFQHQKIFNILIFD